MPKVRLFRGKPILINGKVATSESCCDNCGQPTPPPSNTGSCCLPDNSCVVETLSDCKAAGGTYGGNGTNCVGVDCTCCPFFAHYNTVRFSGSITDGVHGCAFNFSEKTWTRVANRLLLVPYAFSIDGSPCEFLSEDCNPGADTSFVRLGNDDSSSPCFPDAILTADFAVTSGGRCGPFVQLTGSNTSIGCVSGGTNDFTEYDLSAGSLSVMISDSLFPSIIYTFNLSVS